MGGYNLIGTGGSGPLSNTDGNHNQVNVANPGLAPLLNYGGTTQTIALLPGSPAIGTGTPQSGVTADQRSYPIVDPTAPDIGAFQSQGFTLIVLSGDTPQSAAINAAFRNTLSVEVTAKNQLEPVSGGVISFAAPPSIGASAALSRHTAEINNYGVASVTATANSTAGSYTITAAISGTAQVADFQLANLQVVSKVVLMPLAVLNNRKKVISLGLEAEIEPLASGAGEPGGTVTFELLKKHKKPNVLGTAMLSGGTATLTVKLKRVLKQSIMILYSGDVDDQTSTLTTTITRGSFIPMARPTVRVSMRH